MRTKKEDMKKGLWLRKEEGWLANKNDAEKKEGASEAFETVEFITQNEG